MASDKEHDGIQLNVINLPLDFQKEDGELSNHSFESVSNTPLTLSLSQMTLEGAESPFTNISSPDLMSSEEDDDEETDELKKLEEKRKQLLKKVKTVLKKKKKKETKTKEKLLEEIKLLEKFNKISNSEKKVKRRKRKSKNSKRRNTVVGIAQQEHIAQEDDDNIPCNTLNEQNCEDDRLFPSLSEVRSINPTPSTIHNDLKVTIKGSVKPESVSRIHGEEHIGITHKPHSKPKRKKSSDSRDKSPEFYAEIESCSNERIDECMERDKSPMKSHHARHRIGHLSDNTRKTKSKSPNQRRQSRDEEKANKKHHAKSKSPNQRRHSRDKERANKKHAKSKSPNKRRHSRDDDRLNKKHYYEEQSRSSERTRTPPKGYRSKDIDWTRASRSPTKKEKHRDHSPYKGSKSRSPHFYSRSPHLRRKSSHSDLDKRHLRHRSSSSSRSYSSSANSEHSIKFIGKKVIRNQDVVEITSSLRENNSPAYYDKILPLPLNTTSTFFNPNNHNLSTVTPASPEIYIIGEDDPTSISITIDNNKNEQLIVKESGEPIFPTTISPEPIESGGERTFSSFLWNFPFTSKNIPNQYDSNVDSNCNILLPIPAPPSHQSEDNLSDYNVMSMEEESLYDPSETLTEHSDDIAKTTVVEEPRGSKDKIEPSMVYQSGVDETTRNKANLITDTRVVKSQMVIEENTTGNKKPENNTDLTNDQLEKRQSISNYFESEIDSNNTHLIQENSENENSQFVKKISRSGTDLNNTQSVKENYGIESDSKKNQLIKGKLTKTDSSSQKLFQTMANKTLSENVQSTKKHLENVDVIENTRTMKDFLDSKTVGASTQIVEDNFDGESMINLESYTTNYMTCVEDNHRDLDIDLGLDEESWCCPLSNMEQREIHTHQLEMEFLLQNPVSLDFVANGVAEFFSELQSVLCTAAFNKNVKSDILGIEKWFVIINSVYFDLIYRKNHLTFVKLVKYYHILELILDHLQNCVKQSIKMYAKDLPLYIKKIEAIRTWLNCHAEKKKMCTSSVDQYATTFFEKNNIHIKKFLFQYHKRSCSTTNVENLRMQRRKEIMKVLKDNSNVEKKCSPVPKPSKPYLDEFEVTNKNDGNNYCPVPQPSKPHLDVFVVTDKINHMLMLIDGPKVYEMFEKISLETLEHLQNKIKQELQDSEAEEYANKCKELINEKIRIINLKEYIEMMYNNSVVKNNVPLPEQIDKLSAINNDLKSWKSTSSLKQKIKEILLKYEESFSMSNGEANKKNGSIETVKEKSLETVTSNAIDDVVEIAVESNAMERHKKSESIENVKLTVPQATTTQNKEVSVEIVKPTVPQATATHSKEAAIEIVKHIESNATETHNKEGSIETVKSVESHASETHNIEGSIEIVKPVESNASETQKKDGSLEIATHKTNKVIEIEKQKESLENESVEISNPMISNATETFNIESVQIPNPTLEIVDAHEENYSVDMVKLNAKSCKKDDVEPTVSNAVESHKKRDFVDGVTSMVRETEISFTKNLTCVRGLPDNNLNKSSLVNLDDSGTVPMDLDDSGSTVSVGNEISELNDPRLQRQSLSIEPVSSNAKVNQVYAHVDESIVYKLIPLDVLTPFVRARNHLESYSKRKKEAEAKGKAFKLDIRLEKDKMRLKQEIREKLALSKTMNEGLSRTNKNILKDLDKIVDTSVKKVETSVETCDTVNLVRQVKSKDPRLEKRDVGVESYSIPKNVNNQVKSNKKNFILEDSTILLPLPSSQIIESSCAIVQPNKENSKKEAENDKITTNTDPKSKYLKSNSILKTTTRDVLQSDDNNIPCENIRSVNFLQQKIVEIGNALKPKTPTDQIKPSETNSWSRIPFHCSEKNENFSIKNQHYKIPKISRAKETNFEKNISEPSIVKAKENKSEISMNSSEPTTAKDNNLLKECGVKVLKAKEIDLVTNTKCSQPKIKASYITLQVDTKLTDIDNSSSNQALSVAKELTPVKDKLKHTNLKKKNKQIAETKNHVLMEKISKLERNNMLESKKDSEKFDVKKITVNDKPSPNLKVFDLFGGSAKKLEKKRTATESKDGKIKNSTNNGIEEGKCKSKLFAGSTDNLRKHKNEEIVIKKPLNKTKDSSEINRKTNTLQSRNESVQRYVNGSENSSSNYQLSKNYKIMENLFMKNSYLKPFRRDPKLFECRVLLDQSSHTSKEGLLKRKINSSTIEQDLRKKKRIDREGELSNIVVNQTNVSKHNENTDEQSSEINNRTKSTHEEVEQVDIINKGNKANKQKDSNDSLCVNSKKSSLDTYLGENELVMRIKKSELKPIENGFSDRSSMTMEKRSNPKKEEGSQLSNEKVDNSKIMGKVEISRSTKEITVTANIQNETSSEQVNFTSDIPESNEQSVAIAVSNKRCETENVCSIDHRRTISEGYNQVSTESDEMRSRSSKQAINISNNDDIRGYESSEQSNKQNERFPEYGGASEPSSMECNKTRTLQEEEYREKPIEINPSGNDKEKILTNEENEEVQFIKSVNKISKRRDLLKENVNVKETWGRMRKHVAKSKLPIPSTTAIAIIDVEQPCSKKSVESVTEISVPGTTSDHEQCSSKKKKKVNVKEAWERMREHVAKSKLTMLSTTAIATIDLEQPCSKRSVESVTEISVHRPTLVKKQCSTNKKAKVKEAWERNRDHVAKSKLTMLSTTSISTLDLEQPCSKRSVEIMTQFSVPRPPSTNKQCATNKKAKVKEAWEQMREQVAKLKLTMLSYTAISTIDLEQTVCEISFHRTTSDQQQSSTNSSRIEKDSGKEIVENNVPKALFLKRFSLDSDVNRSEARVPIKINLRRCSEDTWETLKEKEFGRAGTHQFAKELNLLERRKQHIEKSIVLLQGKSRSIREPTDLSLKSEDRVGNVKSIRKDLETESDVMDKPCDQSERSALHVTTDVDKSKSCSNMKSFQYRPGPQKRKHSGTDTDSDGTDTDSGGTDTDSDKNIKRSKISKIKDNDRTHPVKDISNQSVKNPEKQTGPTKTDTPNSRIKKSFKTKKEKFNIENFIKGNVEK